jgi:hypothetical protein
MEVREAVIVEEHDDGYPKEAAAPRFTAACRISHCSFVA